MIRLLDAQTSKSCHKNSIGGLESIFMLRLEGRLQLDKQFFLLGKDQFKSPQW